MTGDKMTLISGSEVEFLNDTTRRAAVSSLPVKSLAVPMYLIRAWRNCLSLWRTRTSNLVSTP
jgi:hypothetical protein